MVGALCGLMQEQSVQTARLNNSFMHLNSRDTVHSFVVALA